MGVAWARRIRLQRRLLSPPPSPAMACASERAAAIRSSADQATLLLEQQLLHVESVPLSHPLYVPAVARPGYSGLCPLDDRTWSDHICSVVLWPGAKRPTPAREKMLHN